LRTAVKGVASGTLNTLKGSFGSEVNVTLSHTPGSGGSEGGNPELSSPPPKGMGKITL
jgi:hypothetical protein